MSKVITFFEQYWNSIIKFSNESRGVNSQTFNQIYSILYLYHSTLFFLHLINSWNDPRILASINFERIQFNLLALLTTSIKKFRFKFKNKLNYWNLFILFKHTSLKQWDFKCPLSEINWVQDLCVVSGIGKMKKKHGS